MIQATLDGIAQALVDKDEVNYLILLSGQDYPIKSNLGIQRFLQGNPGGSYLSYTPMPVTNWDWGTNGGMERLTHYFIRLGNYRWSYPPLDSPKGIKLNLLVKSSRIFYRLPRKHPTGLKPFGGSTWWILSRDAARYIQKIVGERPDYVKFHRSTALVDEVFFQTILCNGPANITVNLVNDDLRYIDWRNKDKNQGHPAIITMKHCEDLAVSNALFARKFDPGIDSQIIDWIDQNLLKEE
jgi:hypothetical protein